MISNVLIICGIQNREYSGILSYGMNHVSNQAIKYLPLDGKNKSTPVRGCMGCREGSCIIFSGTMAGSVLFPEAEFYDTAIPTWDQNFLVDLTTLLSEHPSCWLHSQTPSVPDIITVPSGVGSSSR